MSKPIFPLTESASSFRDGSRRALIRLDGISSLFKAAVVNIRGEGGVSAQITQDFTGTPFFTVFGTKLSTFYITCTDFEMVGCNTRTSAIQKIMDGIRTDTARGDLKNIRLSCDTGAIVSGYLINVEYKIERPVSTYTLAVVGTIGGS